MRDSLPAAILFDMDDTLLEFGPPERQLRPICRARAASLGGMDPEELLRCLTEGRVWFWSDPSRHQRGRSDIGWARAQMAAHAAKVLRRDTEQGSRAKGPEPAMTHDPRPSTHEVVTHDPCSVFHGVEAALEEMLREYGARREEGVRLFDRAVETLEALRARGVRLGLITNGDAATQRAKIRRFGLEPYFQHIQIEGEFGAGKPEPRVYLHALHRLRAIPRDTWMVGDNLEWEVRAPQELGIRGIWVDWACQGLPEAAGCRPHRIILSVAELVEGV